MGTYLKNLYKPSPDNPVKQALSARHNFRIIIEKLNALPPVVVEEVGDMLKSVYDPNLHNRVDKAENVDDGACSSSAAAVKDTVDKKHSQNTDTGSDSDPFTLTGKLRKSVQVGITAFATGGQASAVEITKDIVEISVCATAGDSVKLPAAVAGLVIFVSNHGAEAADVFPNTDDAVNEEAVNTAKSLATNASMLCVAYDDTNWECLILAR